jgi:hypothetical protein
VLDGEGPDEPRRRVGADWDGRVRGGHDAQCTGRRVPGVVNRVAAPPRAPAGLVTRASRGARERVGQPVTMGHRAPNPRA